MINLMPDTAKQQLRAARTNTILFRYILVILGSALFLALIAWGAFFLLSQIKDTSQRLIDANDSKTAVFDQTKAQIESLSADLNEVKGILDQEILYSKVMVNIAQQMPANTVLDKLTLDADSFSGKPITLKAYGKSNEDIVQLRNRFQSSSHFRNVNFQNVTENDGIAGYPVSVTMTLTLNRSIAQ